jgi:L-lactate utilization protein LutB
MANIELLQKNLQENGIHSSYFSTAEEAARYLNQQVDGTEVAFGGSCTLQEMGLYESLSTHNQVHWHWQGGTLDQAISTPVYICSMNGVAETGELINIDGTGNRVASTIYGHDRIYIVVGVNKIAPDFDAALWRARNIAAPKNAQRLNRKTPCAVKADRCYNCKSPERVCKALAVLWQKPNAIREMEVVIVGEDLGY